MNENLKQVRLKTTRRVSGWSSTTCRLKGIKYCRFTEMSSIFSYSRTCMCSGIMIVYVRPHLQDLDLTWGSSKRIILTQVYKFAMYQTWWRLDEEWWPKIISLRSLTVQELWVMIKSATWWRYLQSFWADLPCNWKGYRPFLREVIKILYIEYKFIFVQY